MPPGELLEVGLGCIAEVVDGSLCEEEAEHAGDAAAGDRVAVLLAGREDAADESGGDLLQVLVGVRSAQDLHGLDARSHCQWVSGESAGLVHGPGGGHQGHDVLATAVCPHREAAA